jgi:NAD(P)-dependent dehydrogenase (short-subunit alcohol dehydrogenase family)
MDLHLVERTAVVTGGGGAICGAIARGLAAEGAAVAIWDLDAGAGEASAAEIRAAGGSAISVPCDATDRRSVVAALARTIERFGTVDILVAGAGGGRREATTAPDVAFSDIPVEALRSTVDLNYLSAVIPCQEVGRVFVSRGEGAVLVVSSVAGIRPLSRAIAYSNGKAALNSFTQWLAVHMATTYAPTIRVNAVAPGFVLTGQNRFLLVEEETGAPTARAAQILAHVPMGRLGEPDDIVGAALWLVSDRARFVTGVVLPVDGGFAVASGV